MTTNFQPLEIPGAGNRRKEVNSGYLVPYQQVEKVRENLKEAGVYFEMSLSAKGIYFNVWYASYAEKSAMDSILKEVIS